MSKPTETYSDRDAVLSSLNFDSYKEYLSSELWHTIRGIVMRRDSYKCVLKNCTTRRYHCTLHHVSYSRATLLGINPGAIITVCHHCHKLLEFSRGVKLSFIKVQQKTIKYLPRNPKSVPNWLRQRYKSNAATARYIFAVLKRKLPVWYNAIVEDIHSRRIPKQYAEYLRVK